MEPGLRKERWIEIQKNLLDADAELLQLVANWMHTNLSTHAIEMPFETHCVTCKAKLAKPIKQAIGGYMSPGSPVEVAVEPKKITIGGVKIPGISNWVPIKDAPIVKKKAYNPLSLHLKKGVKIMAISGNQYVVDHFTKNTVKAINVITGGPVKLKYSHITHVDV